MLKLLFIALIVSGLNSCKKADIPLDTAQKVFAHGKEMFDDDKYMEAEQMFDKIKLQYPRSLFADSAQFFLGKTYMARKDYVIASYNFSLVERNFPASGLRKESRYRRAMCYYELSPGFDRDHEYTLKAIAEFESYKSLYPGDSLFFEAQKRIDEMVDKLAEKEYRIAELYKKITQPIAAEIYYDYLIDLYPDSKFVEDSKLGKIEMLIYMRKYEKARSAIDVYKKEYPKNAEMPIIKKYENIIENPPKRKRQIRKKKEDPDKLK